MNDQPLKIAFDAKRLFSNYTGLGNYSRTLVRNLVKFFPRHEYHLFTPVVEKNTETAFFFEQKNIHIHSPGKTNKFLWRTFLQSALINKINPDIYQGLSHEIPFGLDARIVKVVTFHDLIWELYPQQFGWFDRKSYHFRYQSSARRADHLLAISNNTKEDLINLYQIPSHKISVIYQSCGSYFQTPTFYQGPKKHFLYVGSIIPRKGLDKIIMAYALLPDGEKRGVKIVGSGKGVYFDKCKSLIEYYHLENHFTFLGGLANNDLATLYDESIALVFPSIYEGFGIPVIEAIHRGCSVITSNKSSLPEAAVAISTLVDPEDIHDITRAMRLSILHANVPAKEEIDQALLPFSDEVTASKLMKLYLDLGARKL